ncbi:hypothetical protein BOX15_Mlig023432g1 [Macrostomum lignano]|uniref:Uncharacterized protein n=1 Tax=Macrostomum lignano TaxID=282301 RepID=A0A267ECY1_9PLAT|nr:hypothetical protein BOX15_Mlig023432g1 [Macrostomum lignano]
MLYPMTERKNPSLLVQTSFRELGTAPSVDAPPAVSPTAAGAALVGVSEPFLPGSAIKFQFLPALQSQALSARGSQLSAAPAARDFVCRDCAPVHTQERNMRDWLRGDFRWPDWLQKILLFC